MRMVKILKGSEKDALKAALSEWRQIMYMRGWLDPISTSYDDAMHRHDRYLWDPSV